MTPRFVVHLASDAFRKPRTPPETGEGFVDAIPRGIMNKATEGVAIDAFILTRIVVQRGELDQLAHDCDRTIYPHLLRVSKLSRSEKIAADNLRLGGG